MANCVLCSRRPTLKKRSVRKPGPWTHPEGITRAQLRTMRQEFWAQVYGQGTRETSKLVIAQGIIDFARIFLHDTDMTVCYDERGVRYELPLYVLSEPTNLIEN